MVNVDMARRHFKLFFHVLSDDADIWDESQFEDCLEAYDYLGRDIPHDIDYTFAYDERLRTLAFDALAGDLCDRSAELPESLRGEYWRRRWIQLAIQGRCTEDEFADGMLSENAR